MRIIAGSRKGHKLKEFDGLNVRPTTDRVKESIFNLIQEHIQESNTLDLFAGSGALSFEALSRGARFSTLVDISADSVKIIKQNQEDLKFDNLEIINSDARSFLSSATKKFDIIFLDPPYNKGFVEPIMEDVVKYNILSDGGIVVLESDQTDEHSYFSGLEIIKQRKYGRTFVTVYQRG